MKPDIIFKLEQGEEPWVGDGAVPRSASLGECVRTRRAGEGGVCSARPCVGGRRRSNAPECSFDVSCSSESPSRVASSLVASGEVFAARVSRDILCVSCLGL